MTRERAKELLPVIEAWARGEEVQLSINNGKTWIDVKNGGECMFDGYDTKWRIKPKPLEVWGVVEPTGVYTYGGTRESASEQYEHAVKRGSSNVRLIKLREVVE